MDKHGPLEEEVRAQAQGIGEIIGNVLPEGWGFALLIFPFGEGTGRMNYISNADRKTMLLSLKELVAVMEGN